MQHSSRDTIRSRVGEGPSAEVVSLDEWRRAHGLATDRRRRARPVAGQAPAGRRKVSVELLLVALVLVSAAAGALFALMYAGRFP